MPIKPVIPGGQMSKQQQLQRLILSRLDFICKSEAQISTGFWFLAGAFDLYPKGGTLGFQPKPEASHCGCLQQAIDQHPGSHSATSAVTQPQIQSHQQSSYYAWHSS